jgi:hypothetical protein
LQRAAAIVAGFATTVAGYLVGAISLRFSRKTGTSDVQVNSLQPLITHNQQHASHKEGNLVR